MTPETSLLHRACRYLHDYGAFAGPQRHYLTDLWDWWQREEAAARPVLAKEDQKIRARLEKEQAAALAAEAKAKEAAREERREALRKQREEAEAT